MTTAARPDASAERAEDVERAMMLAESLRNQLGMVEEQRAMLQATHGEIQRAAKAIEALRDAKPGDALLMPLGAGTYTRAKLATPDRILANVGSGVHVEADLEDAAKRLAERAEAAERAMERLAQEGGRLQAEYVSLLRELQAAEER